MLAESSFGMIVIPIVLVGMYRLTIPFEEAHLAARFGTEYADYCRRVARFPRLTSELLIGAGTSMPSLRTIPQQLPVIATVIALMVLAEAHGAFPHLLR